jgi:hypothetical protein
MEDVHGLCQARPVKAAAENSPCLGKLGFYSQKDQLTRKVLGLRGTKSCLLRPISGHGRHLTRTVCGPNRPYQPCRSMRKCPTTGIELGLSSAHPPLSEASFRCSQAFGKGKGIQNAASSSKGQESWPPQQSVAHCMMQQSRPNQRQSLTPTANYRRAIAPVVSPHSE